jgi:hypothetical protein
MDTTYDMILGMGFCEWISVLLYHWQLISNLILDDLVTNVYMLLDYGDFVDATTSNTASPYVQLLSTTDPAAAHNDFVATRLNGTDTSGSQHKPGSGSGSGSNNNSTVGGAKGFFDKYKIPIIAGAAGAVVLLLLTSAFVQYRSRKPVYRPLFEPAPAGSMQMNTVSGYNTGMQSSADYYNGGAPAYSDPWGRRS